MSRPIKYSASTTSGSYNKGNVAIAVNSINFGPTSATGWYTGVTPTGGNFVVTEVVNGAPPRFYVPSTEAEWIRLAKQEGATGANTGSSDAVKSWFASQDNYYISNIELPIGMPSIVGNGLVLNLDARINESYPGTGTTWTDISGLGNNGTLVNGTTFDSNGAIEFDGVDDFGNFSSAINFDDGSPFTAQCLISIPYFTGQNLNRVHWISGVGGNSMMIFNSTSFFMWNEAGGVNNLNINYNFPTNKIFQATITRDSNNVVSLYVNGTYINQGSRSGQFRWATFARLGSITAYCSRFSLYNMMVYGKSLSSTEVLQNYYQAPIVTDGLVLAVDAGNLVSYESGSTTTYSLTGSLSGSLDNGTGYLPDNGGTWDFDGTNDQINFGNQSSLGFTSGVFSVEAWIYIPSSWTAGSQYPNLVSKGAKAGWDTDGWSLFCFRNYGSGTGYAVGIGLRNSGTTNIRVAYNQPTDVWLHVMGTLDGSSIKVYVNGGLQVNQSQTINPASNSSNVLIGRDTQGNSFPGKIANVKTYNKTLSDSEVLQNYNAQKSRFI